MDLEAPLAGSCSTFHEKRRHTSRAIVAIVFVLLAVTAWARGGSAEVSPWVQFVFASMVFTIFAWEMASVGGGVWKGLVRDPILYMGIGLLALVGLQWFNSGRDMVYISGIAEWPGLVLRQLNLSSDTVSRLQAGVWCYTDPPYPHLPFAFKAAEAMQVWVWFYAGLAVVLSIRSRLVSRRGIYRLWRLMLANSVLLGLFGMIQLLTGTSKIFWLRQLPHQRFYASFAYANHAGSFFLLMLFLSLSMLVRELFRDKRPKFTMRVFFLLVCAAINLMSCNLTLSRFAILASWCGMVGVALYVIGRLWRRAGKAVRLNAAVLIICFGIAGLYGSIALSGVSPVTQLKTFMQMPRDLFGSGRSDLVDAGFRIWSDHPWFGSGPWGYRHLVGLNLEEALHHLLRTGTANIHNDAVQFLAEEGIVGFGLMAAMSLALLSSFRLRILRNWVPGIILLAGVAAIGLQSLGDLPMRNPAVFYCWLAIVAGAGRISSEKLCEEVGSNSLSRVGKAASDTKGGK